MEHENKPMRTELSTVNEEGRATLPADARKYTGVYETGGLIVIGVLSDDSNEAVWSMAEVHENGKFTLNDAVRKYLGIDGERADDVEIYVDEA